MSFISGDRSPVGRTRADRRQRRSISSSTCCPAYRPNSRTAGIGASRAAIVEVGKDTQVDVVLGVGRRRRIVVVTAASPIVDVRSTEVSFNFSADTFNSLPLERSYRGLFQLIPGVADNRSPVGPRPAAAGRTTPI